MKRIITGREKNMKDYEALSRAHFDAQAWYQPRKTPTPLTAIEQLNVQIIQAEEADRQ